MATPSTDFRAVPHTTFRESRALAKCGCDNRPRVSLAPEPCKKGVEGATLGLPGRSPIPVLL